MVRVAADGNSVVDVDGLLGGLIHQCYTDLLSSVKRCAFKERTKEIMFTLFINRLALSHKLMRRPLICILTIAVSATSQIGYAAPAGSGNSGQLVLSGLGSTCFKTSSKLVPKVCGAPVVHYKISTLMGDPLGSYGLTWKLNGFQIANAKTGGSQDYLAGGVPSVIWDAAQKSELWLYGAASVFGRHAALQFNTGLGVKPGGELSFNVPDGYNWDKFLVRDLGVYSACSIKNPTFVSPKEAKDMLRNGLQLLNFQVCQNTSVDVDKLERAITAYCKANPNGRANFCPKEQKAKNVKESADPFAALALPNATTRGKRMQDVDAFSELEHPKTVSTTGMEGALEAAEKERVATIERQRRYDTAFASCKQDMERQESCVKGSCGKEPESQICTKSVWNSGATGTCNGGPGVGCLSLGYDVCEAYGANPEHAKWESCLREAPTRCAPQGKKITNLSACTSERIRQ